MRVRSCLALSGQEAQLICSISEQKPSDIHLDSWYLPVAKPVWDEILFILLACKFSAFYIPRCCRTHRVRAFQQYPRVKHAPGKLRDIAGLV